MGTLRNAVSFMVVAVLLMTVAKAATYIVGDAAGWTSDVDYKAWASGKSFNVNDTLVFKYTIYHSLRRVSEQDYHDCDTSHPIRMYKTGGNGNTTILLNELGKWHFVCAAIGHCSHGMKLAIDTSGAPYSDISPPPPGETEEEQASNSANKFSLAGSFALTLVSMMLAAI